MTAINLCSNFGGFRLSPPLKREQTALQKVPDPIPTSDLVMVG